MKRFFVVATLATVTLGQAVAADLPSRPIVSPTDSNVLYDWSGFYLGAHVGGVGTGGKVATDPSSGAIGGNGDYSDSFKSGATGGVQLGYNWQIYRNLVAGLEGDISGLGSSRANCDIDDCSLITSSPLIITSKTDYLATLRGRLGYAWDRSLLYVTGGLAIAEVKDSFNFFSATDIDSHSATKTGYAVGAGIETALTSNWTIKAEYLYANAGTNRVYTSDGRGYLDFEHEYHIGRLGLNWRFADPSDRAASVAPAPYRVAKAPAGVTGPYNWSGFYLGATLGGVAAGGQAADPLGILGGNAGRTDLFRSAVTGGAQAGYNWHLTPNWVLGLEGDIASVGNRSVCDTNDCDAAAPVILTAKTNYLSTARGRLGYAWDRSLLYVTGGLAVADVKDSFTNFSVAEVDSRAATKTGYAVGAGVETALWSNWTLKAEYLYANAGTNRVFTADRTGYLDFDHEYHLGRLGLNWHFGNGL